MCKLSQKIQISFEIDKKNIYSQTSKVLKRVISVNKQTSMYVCACVCVCVCVCVSARVCVC